MKKWISIFVLCLSSLCFAGEVEEAYKAYPFQNAYDATILGSSVLMMEGVSEDIPLVTEEIPGKEFTPLAGNLWLDKDFSFSLVKQKEKAPLVFLLAGTGSSYHTTRMKYFQRILSDAGYHVISISSQMSVNFVAAASTSHVPGLLAEDAKDMYAAMKRAYEKVKNEIEVEDFYIMGYSLGGTNAAYLSHLDEEEGYFDFKRVLMINPAVDLYASANILDDALNALTKKEQRALRSLLEGLLQKVEEAGNTEYMETGENALFRLYQKANLDDAHKAALIGLVFRLNAIDLHYVTDLLSQSGVYTEPGKQIGKFTPLLPYFEKIDFADFHDYVEKIALPYYKRAYGKVYTAESLQAATSLYSLKEYLQSSKKIAAVTNADELILSDAERDFLKENLGSRCLIYPRGGHCGNMFFAENVKIMLQYLKTGELYHEK